MAGKGVGRRRESLIKWRGTKRMEKGRGGESRVEERRGEGNRDGKREGRG